MPAPDLVGDPQELGEALELGGGEAAGEGRVPVGLEGAPDLAGPLVELGGDLDRDAAAVLRISDAARVAGALEAVDHAGDGSGGQAGVGGDLAGGEAAAVLDRVEAEQVGAVDAEALGSEVVERAVLVAARAEGGDELVDELALGRSFRGWHASLLATKILAD